MPDYSIRERIGRIQTEIEAIDSACGDAPDEFTNCVFCVVRDCEEMLLQLEEYEERVETEDRRVREGLGLPTHPPRHIVPEVGMRPYLEVGE